MTFLPIVVRELRVAARRKGPYRMRFWTVFAAILFVSWAALGAADDFYRTGGVVILTTLAAVCSLFCLVQAGGAIDCISEEKREGTLGFLFLTDLKGYDIVAGKLFSTSLSAFYALLGVTPIIAISLLLGGVGPGDVTLLALTILNLFFFANAGCVCISAYFQKRSAGSAMGALLLLGSSLVVPIMDGCLNGTRLARLASDLEIFNPVFPVFCMCSKLFNGALSAGGSVGGLWSSLLTVHLMAWCFLGLASWWLPRGWQEKPKKSKANRWRPPWLALEKRRLKSKPYLLKNPFYWLVMRKHFGASRVWITLIAMNCFWGWLLFRIDEFNDAMGVFTGIVLGNHLVLKIIAASEASNTLEEERHSGRLEMLLSCTPLSTREIIRGQWLAILRQIAGPMVFVVSVDIVVILVAGQRAHIGSGLDEKFGFAILVIAGLLMLGVDTVVLGWVGMWQGMSQRRLRGAGGSTVLIVFVHPWVLFIIAETLLQQSDSPLLRGFPAAVVLWVLCGLLVEIPVALYAQRCLMNHFRRQAAVYGQNKISFAARLGGWLGRKARQ